MKKQLIAIGLASVLTAPSVALADATIYGSFRTGLEFASGSGASDAAVRDVGSRFGLKGSSEVSEGLTASFKLEHKFNTATASLEGKDESTDDGGRIGMVGLAGGFGSIALGNMWTASGVHYGFAVDPTLAYGVFGGANYRKARMVSYSSSVGAVGFQIDRHTTANGTATVEFGASTSAGPVNVGLGYWSQEDDDKTKDPKTSFTGFVVSSSLAGMNLAVGVGSTDTGKDSKLDTTGKKDDELDAYDEVNDRVDQSQTDVSIVTLTGSVGDSGVSYVVQMSDSDESGKVDEELDKDGKPDTWEAAFTDPSQTVVNLTSALGGGASLVFEHVSKKSGTDKSLVALRVDF